MLILLSPSKTLDFTTELPKNLQTSTPVFQKEADQLAAEMKKLSAAQIAKMMKVSTKIAELNYFRFQNFSKDPEKVLKKDEMQEKKSQPTEAYDLIRRGGSDELDAADRFFQDFSPRPALFAFIGDVYRDIKPHDYSTQELAFANAHIRTLSGLYGLLKPLDLIKPYRLEMHHKTDFWKTKITEALQKETDTVIDLASKEYSKPLNLKKFTTYTPIFKEKKGQEYKIVALYAKIARGTMTNWIVKNAITNPEALKNFTEDGYKFAPKLSTKHDLVFTRG